LAKRTLVRLFPEFVWCKLETTPLAEVYELSDDQVEELRVLVRSGRYVQAARDAEVLIAEGALGPVDLSHAYHVQSVALYQTDKLVPAYHAARKAEALATEWGLTDLGGRIRINLIALLRDIGEYRAAAEVGARLLDTEEKLSPDTRGQLPRVRYNLARVQRVRHEAEVAYELLEQAIATAEAAGFDPGFRADAHQLMAWWLLEDDRVAAADPHLEAAGALIQPEDVTRQREQLLIACHVAYRIGDSEAAIAMAGEFVPMDAPATQRQRVWACLISTWVAIDQADWPNADLFATTAQTIAIELQAPDLMNRANDLKRQIHEHRPAAGD
jgi:hypothetical protein